MLVLNLPSFENKNYIAEKRFVWRNTDQERTNQNARVSLKTTLPYNNKSVVIFPSWYPDLSALGPINMVSGTALPLPPPQGNFKLISLQNPTNRLHEDHEFVSGDETTRVGELCYLGR